MSHSRRLVSLPRALLIIAAAMPPITSAAESDSAALSNPAAAQELPQVIVIGNAPLQGFGLPMNQIPSNVQTASSKDIQKQQSLDMTDYINNNFSGINISESQDNPFQTDVNYHGFTASPLLGTPEGLSVYVDGVRVNESFGDTVNWDLIPESAISTVSLMGGSNPVFGLNTLGGALSVQTKSGHDNPGTELQAYGGSFGRRSFEGETGGSIGNFDYFFTGNYFDEDGWRDLSPTKIYQGFGKVGWQTEATDIDLSYTYADTSMIGNGTTPLSMLYFRRPDIYSAPDFTHNFLNFVNLTGTQLITERVLLAGEVYYRHLETGSNNGDINDDNYLSDDYGGPPIDCSAALDTRAEAAYCLNGINRASRTIQKTTGFSLQLTDSDDLFGMKNQGLLGVAYDSSTDSYNQQFQYGNLTPNRSVISVVVPANNLETVNFINGSNKIFGAYFTDTLSPSKLLHFTASVRYNSNTESLGGYSLDTDVGDYGDGFDEPIALSGKHTFARFNPAFGFTFTPNDKLTLYANYNEASRAPTVIELGCSDPDNPCGLPNDFSSDPDLKQVVARTEEIGFRGNLPDQSLMWSFDAFHTINSNDIQFISTSVAAGFFDNVGSTKRQGFDVAFGGKHGGFSWHLAYSFVDATYQSTFTIDSESNSTADEDGLITVRPGDRIPLIPRNTGRLFLGYEYNQQWDVGATLVAASGSFLHGDENNANVAGATNGEGATTNPVTGTGVIPSYMVVNMQGTYHLGKNIDLFARLVNVLNKQYATAGFLTDNVFNPNGTFRADPDDWTNENAVSPAQPRAVWGGVRIRF
jgi:outer membrane receptor protein involved in Fe transport